MTKVDRLITEVQARLGLSRLLGRRALTELRDHLDDSVADQLSRGVGQAAAEEVAVQQLGSPDELVTSVIEASKGLRMIAFLKRHVLATAAVLAAPGILLLGLSFLTYNFPCGEKTAVYMGDSFTYHGCGVSAIQWLRPAIAVSGIYGGGVWILQWTIHILSVAGPLLAAVVIISSQLSSRRQDAQVTDIALAFPTERQHLLALVATLALFLIVAAYKVAG